MYFLFQLFAVSGWARLPAVMHAVLDKAALVRTCL
jgi:hypothetical protein